MNSFRLRSLAWLALVVTVGLGVAATPPAKVAAGTFVWHDLVTDNAAAAQKFYGELFGWTFEPGKGVDPGYTIIREHGVPIGGIVAPKEAVQPQWVSYVVVPDVDRAVDAFKQAGGTVFRGPLKARADLRVAAVADAQGATIGLANRGPLEGVSDAVPDIHRWLWMDYVAHDANPALEFYSRVFGYKSEATETRGTFTYYRLTNERPRAGLFASPWPRETSLWLPYVRVADAAASAARAQQLGGTIVVPTSPQVRNGSLAIVLDPGGAPLALQKFPFDAGVTR